MSIEQVKEKLAESERVFVSIEKEVAELNNQITEINNNKNSLADNNKKHEAMRLEAEARVEELEGQGQENKDKQAERGLHCRKYPKNKYGYRKIQGRT